MLNKKNILRSVGAGLVVVGAFGIFLLYQNVSSPIKFTSEGISFEYPKAYQVQPAATETKDASQAESIVKLEAQKPLRLVELAKETGAIKGANITRTNFLDYLERNAKKSLPARYKDYSEIQSNRVVVAGHDASELVFSYTATDNKTTLYYHFLIVPMGNDAYYMTLQSPDKTLAKHDAAGMRETLRLP